MKKRDSKGQATFEYLVVTAAIVVGFFVADRLDLSMGRLSRAMKAKRQATYDRMRLPIP